MFSRKVLIGDTIFTSHTWDGTTIMWSSKPHACLAICKVKAVPSFLSYFKTLSILPSPGIEPLTSHSAIKHSTNRVRANPAMEKMEIQKRGSHWGWGGFFTDVFTFVHSFPCGKLETLRPRDKNPFHLLLDYYRANEIFSFNSLSTETQNTSSQGFWYFRTILHPWN